MMGGAKAHYDGIVAFSQTDFTDDLTMMNRGHGLLSLLAPPFPCSSESPAACITHTESVDWSCRPKCGIGAARQSIVASALPANGTLRPSWRDAVSDLLQSRTTTSQPFLIRN